MILKKKNLILNSAKYYLVKMLKAIQIARLVMQRKDKSRPLVITNSPLYNWRNHYSGKAVNLIGGKRASNCNLVQVIKGSLKLNRANTTLQFLHVSPRQGLVSPWDQFSMSLSLIILLLLSLLLFLLSRFLSSSPSPSQCQCMFLFLSLFPWQSMSLSLSCHDLPKNGVIVICLGFTKE